MKSTSATICIVLLVVSQNFRAGAEAPGKLHDPDVLPGVKNKIAVLEYDNPGKTRWGLELSEILSREIIGSMQGVSSVGVVNLRQDDNRVDLNLKNVLSIARTQKALVVIWGEFYESGNKIYLHSHLRIVPPDSSAKSARGLSFQTRIGQAKATPPSLLLNFAPIGFTTESLRTIRLSHEQTATIRAGPEVTASEVGHLKTEDGFGVEEVKGEWMRIRTQAGTPGWVHYAALENQAELAGLRGVVYFAQGVLQYLVGNYELAETTMSTYLDRCGKQNAANLGLPNILLGNARI